MVSYEATVLVMFTISKIFGLFPYTLSGQQLPKAYQILSLVANLVQFSLTIAILAIDIFVSQLYLKSDVFRFTRRIVGKIAFAMSIACHVFWQTRHPGKIGKCLKTIQAISKYLRSRNFTFFSGPMAVLELGAVMLITVFSDLFRRLGAFDAIAGFILPFCGNIIFLGQFYAFMEVIRCLLLDLNQFTMSSHDLQACANIHAVLCAVVEDVNQVYYTPLLMGFIGWVATLLTLLFQLFETASTGEPHPGFLLTVPLSIVSQTLLMLCICYISYEVHYESEAFKDTLCCSIRNKYPPDYKRKLVLYLAMRPSVKITAHHLFTVDTGILATIMGTVITYFIVLVQFILTAPSNSG